MRNFDIFDDRFHELKPGWFIRKPIGFTMMDMRKWRFEPVSTTMLVMAMSTAAVGTGLSIYGSIQQGKQQEAIAKQRAEIDRKNAEAARQAAEEKAKITAERGRRLLATQKGNAAAGNIRINVGVPLVIEAETRANITRDVGFIMQGGRAEEDYYNSSALLEEATGKNAKRNSYWNAASSGLSGFGSIAYMAYTGFGGGSSGGSSGGGGSNASRGGGGSSGGGGSNASQGGGDAAHGF